ncbi:SCO-spondin [Fopius arisanus]|uniref:AMCI_0 protein n=1 Tax=Fopius arisanus TaxID=64838 RepID=A0A0C9QMF5_9HYME|nr:PREDICTED: SCO-spondin-like [Fopius arisanus]
MMRPLNLVFVVIVVVQALNFVSVQTSTESEDSSGSNSSEVSHPGPRCTARCTGGPHDKCTLCGTVCPLTCDRPEIRACTKQCAVNVCRCEEGYVRNADGQCVKPRQCPRREPGCTRRCTGGPHDRCTLCGSACPRTCDRPNPTICTLQCLVNVCECERGYVRNDHGQCVRPNQCPPLCTRRCFGGPHDHCTLCGSACPLTCARPYRGICTEQCLVNVCECASGYVRGLDGQCIRQDQCPQVVDSFL